MFDWQAFLKLIVSNALSKKPIMAIFYTSLTVIIVSLIASSFAVVPTILGVVPAYVWVLCLFCFYFLVINKQEATKAVKEEVKQKELWHSTLINRLKNLTQGEQEILRGYIINKTYTQTLQVTNGVVIGMENDDIIQRVGKIPNDNKWGFDFNINKWVWEHLNNHPELIEITNRKTT